MLTIFEHDGIMDVCADNENMTHFTVEEFFSKKLPELVNLKTDIFVHNLTFWGPVFILNLHKMGFTDLSRECCEDPKTKVEAGTFSYTVSDDNGAFYSIKAGVCKIFEFLNLCALSDDDLRETFGDCMAVSMHRCVNQIRGLGTRATTISSAAFLLWKNTFNRFDFSRLFVEKDIYDNGFSVREAYFGGLCYIKPGIAGRKLGAGAVYDCNSLYPFVMKNCSFPVGEGRYVKGDLPEWLRKSTGTTFFVRFKAVFKLKKDHMPFLRTHGDDLHYPDELLETSDYVDDHGNLYKYVQTVDEETGEIINKRISVTLTLYRADFELMFEQYDVEEIEYIDYVYYAAGSGIFDQHINRFYEMKKNAQTAGERRIAKLIQNALSGRMAIKTERWNVLFDEKSWEKMESHNLHSLGERQRGKKTDHYMGDCLSDYAGGMAKGEIRSGSFPHIGAAITSEARAYMVRKIQKNWRGFRYTDTDSIHTSEKIVDMNLSDELGDFKVEHMYENAVYYKQKVYTMFDDSKTGKLVHVTFAGLPGNAQRLLEQVYEYRIYRTDIRKIEKPDGVDNMTWKRFIKQVKDVAWNGMDEEIKVDLPIRQRRWVSYSPARYEWFTKTMPIDLYRI